MKNRCRCGNPFSNENLADWTFPSREEGNKKFAKCKKCDREWEAFIEPSEEGAPLTYWIDPDLSLGNNKK